MSTSNNVKLFNDCEKHKYKAIAKWSAFDRKDTCNTRIKQRWSECQLCKKKNKLKTNERETFGTKAFYRSIEEILQDEQIECARILLIELYKGKNNKHWPSLKKKLLNRYSFEVLDSTRERLHDYGILKVHEIRVKLGWLIKKVSFNETFEMYIQNFIGTENEQLPEWITNPFPPLECPATPKSKGIYGLLLKQKVLFENNEAGVLYDSLGKMVVSTTSSANGYYKLIRLIYGVYENLEKNRVDYWKTFSQRIFGDTKMIKKKDKQRLEQLLGKNLEKYGILSERTEVVLSGDFTWSYNGYENTSRAVKDYISLPRDMIRETKITSWQTSSLLIIENPALFYSVVKGRLLDTKEWSVLLGSGFISSGEISIIIQASNEQLKKVYIWPDLDPYGYQIANDILNKIRELKIPLYLFGYTLEWFKRMELYKPLDSFDFQVIEQLLKQGNLQPEVKSLLVKMKQERKKAEQEILISYFRERSLHDYLLESIQLNPFHNTESI